MKKNSKKNIVNDKSITVLKMVTDIMFIIKMVREYHGYECGICQGTFLNQEMENVMSDDDVKQQALEQAQQAYGLFIWFVKWFSYVMIFMITLMFMNNWFDDGTGSRFMPDEIVDEDQYDPKGLNKKKGI